MESADRDSSRFMDDGRYISDFASEFLVVCPQCEQCARVIIQPDAEQAHPMPVFRPRRLVCPSCGYSKEKAVNGYCGFPDKDWYFNLPLWLSVNCAGGTVWAFNWNHLSWMERYVRATLREKRRDPQYGWSNNSAANRLPEWIKSAKNRTDILHGMERLKQRSGNTKPIHL